MFNKFLIWSALSFFSLAVVFANSQNSNNNSDATFSLPDNAKALEHAPNVFDLGEKTDPETNKSVHGYAILHYKKANAKPGGGGWGGSTCYGFLASEAKWKVIEPWKVNGTNTDWISANDMFTIINGAVSKWESAAANTSVFGAGTLVTDTLDAWGDINGANEIVFGSIDEPGVIAVTTVRWNFGGAPRNRQLVERDQVYDQDDFDWATDGNSTDMDLDNIATHEVGHAFGLGDLFSNDCTTQTMYGYASEGQINKRSLEAGDIAGINKLY